MSALFPIVLMLGLPFAFGAMLVRLIGVTPRSDPIAFVAHAWIAGCLGTGLVVFGWLWTGLGTASVLVPAAAVAALALAAALLGGRVAPAAADAPGGRGLESMTFVAVLTLAIAFVVVRIASGTLHPILVGDEAEFWALKSKIIYTSGGFNDKFIAAMNDPNRIVYHKDYPVLNLMLQVWAFACSGHVTHVANRLPFQVFALAELLIVASAVRRAVRPLAAALLVLVLLGPAKMAAWTELAMSDLMVSVGVVAAFDAFYRWYRGSGTAWFRLGAVAVALMLWSKNEGVFYSLCTAAAIVVSVAFEPSRLASRRLWRAVPWLALPAGVLSLHLWFNAHHGFVSAFSEPEEGNLITFFLHRFSDHVMTVLDYFAREIVFSPGRSNLIPACFFALVVAGPIMLWRSALRVPTLALLFAWAGLVAVFVAHPTPPPSDITQQLVNGAQRVSFQIYAASIVWIAIYLSLSTMSMQSAAARISGPSATGSTESFKLTT